MNTSTLSLSFAPTIQHDTDQPTQFMGIAYSGGLIPGYGFFGDSAIDLSTLKVPAKPVFALLNHDTNQRVGKLTLENNQSLLNVMGSFSQATDAGKQVAAEFAEGAPWEFSVGIQAVPEVFDKPKTLEVNGQQLTVKTLFRHATIREVSFVPAGADPNTQAIAFEPSPSFPHLESIMTDESTLNEVNRLNADLTMKIAALEADHQKVVTDFEAKLAAQQQQITEQFERASEAEAKLEEMLKATRLSAIKTLFEELDMTFSDEKALPYQAMSDEMFASVCADFRAMKQPLVKSDFFKETVTSGKTEKSEVDFASQLFKQVAGVK
jgi:hypothetical protein